MAKKKLVSGPKKKQTTPFLDRLSVFLAEDAFMMVLVALVIMVGVFFFRPSTFGTSFFEGVPVMAYLFYLLNFTIFKFIYFVTLTLFLFWLSKKLFSRFWQTPIRWVFLSLGFVIAFGIFTSLPSDVYDENLLYFGLVYIPTTEDVSFYEAMGALKPGESIPEQTGREDIVTAFVFRNSDDTGRYYLREYDTPLCEDTIEYIYNFGCGATEAQKPAMEEAKQRLKTPFEEWCIGSACKEAGVRYPYDMESFVKEHKGMGSELPVLVIGCRYRISGRPTAEDILNIVCEKIDDCPDQ